MIKRNTPYSSLDTPAVLLDLDLFESNVREMSRLAEEAGVRLRPHVKIHGSAALAKMQIEAGADGIEVGNVAQAVCMADEGIDDILIVHPFFGERKMEALQSLLSRESVTLGVVVDMAEQAEALSRAARGAGRKVPLYIKIDTGVNRYGVPPGEPALALAGKLRGMPDVELAGIYAHESGAEPTDEGVAKAALDVGTAAVETAGLLRDRGFDLQHVAVGASPTLRATCRYLAEGKLKGITEIHPGAFAVGDIMYTMSHANTKETCALTVLTTVVSTSHSSHAVIDAGYKTFGMDSLIQYRDSPEFFWEKKPSFGSVKERPDLWFGRIGAESGVVFYKGPGSLAGKSLGLGERLQIVPNNATLVINLHDRMYGVRNGGIEMAIPVTGRGAGS